MLLEESWSAVGVLGKCDGDLCCYVWKTYHKRENMTKQLQIPQAGLELEVSKQDVLAVVAPHTREVLLRRLWNSPDNSSYPILTGFIEH